MICEQKTYISIKKYDVPSFMGVVASVTFD